jgi:hypothetical protein
MELDGYNVEQKLAFEYQGEPHYLPIFGASSLQRIKRNDERKRQLCRYHGVRLIRVPYWVEDIRAFLRRKL